MRTASVFFLALVCFVIQCQAAEFQPLPTEQPVTSCCLSEDGTLLFLAHESANLVTVWDVSSHSLKAKVTTPTPCSLVARGGKVFVANFDKGTISVLGSESAKSDNWKVLDQLLVGTTAPYHLSAAQGKLFKGQLLVSAGEYTKHRFVLVDAALDKARVVGEQVYDAFAQVSYNGGQVLLQGEPTHSPSCTSQLFTFNDFVTGKSNGQRCEHEDTPVLRQITEGAFWVGGKYLYAGSPPVRTAAAADTQLALIDGRLPIVYVLAPTHLDAIRLNMAMSAIGSIPVTYKPGEPQRRQGYDYRISPPLAVTLGHDLHLFVPTGINAALLWCTVPAFAEQTATEAAHADTPKASAKPGADSFPLKVAEGVRITHPLLQSNAKAICLVVNGPKGITISDDGVLAWTPSKEDLGSQTIKIRVEQAGENTFLRLTTEVVGKEIAD